MNEISLWTGPHGPLARDVRQTAKACSKYAAQAAMRTAAVDAETDVALVKIDALTHATGSSMSAVVRVAQAQRHLEQLAPEAAGRLAFLADDHMLSVSGVMADFRRDLRRK